MSASFDLVMEPWIPVRRNDGTSALCGIREALVDARLLREIQDASPLVVASLHRLLLAVLHRALEGPEHSEDTADWLAAGAFPRDRVEAYLAEWGDRFDLFHPERPFYQVPDLTLDISRKPWTFLPPERSSGNNALLFDHTQDEDVGPAPAAQVARALLAHQTFVPAGLMRVLGVYTASASPAARDALVLVSGASLFETLCLNLVPYPSASRDVDEPVWEREPWTVGRLQGGVSDTPRGPAGLYTWLSRGMRLFAEEGQESPMVRWIAYGPGVVATAESPPNGGDPMSAYRLDKKVGYLPQRFRQGRDLWRDFMTLLPDPGIKRGNLAPKVLSEARRIYAELGVSNRAVSVMILGQATDKAKVLFWRSERFHVPTALLDDEQATDTLQDALDAVESAWQAMRTTGRAVAAKLLATGKRDPHPQDISNLMATFPMEARYWSALQAAFPSLLAMFRPPWRAGEIRAAWNRILLNSAQDAWAATVAAVGTDARTLRAIQYGRREMNRRLRRLREQTEQLETAS